MISFVLAARDDGYGGTCEGVVNFAMRRLQLTVASICELRINAEIVIVEWCPKAEHHSIRRHLKGYPVRVIRVPRSVQHALDAENKGAPLPFYEYVAKEIGIRASSGEIVVACNPDNIFPRVGFATAMEAARGGCMVRALRRELPRAVAAYDVVDTIRLCEQHVRGETDVLKVRAVLDGAAGDFCAFSHKTYERLGGYRMVHANWHVDGDFTERARAMGIQVVQAYNHYHVNHDFSGNEATGRTKDYEHWQDIAPATVLAAHAAAREAVGDCYAVVMHFDNAAGMCYIEDAPRRQRTVERAEWWQERKAILETLVVPALKAQHFQDFDTWALFDQRHADLSAETRETLERAGVLTSFHGPDALRDYYSGARNLVLIHLDSDDLYGPDAIGLIARQQIAPGRMWGFKEGFIYDLTSGRLAEYDPPAAPPFWATVYTRKALQSQEAWDAYRAEHQLAKWHYQTEGAPGFEWLPGRHFCVLTHGSNTSTNWDHNPHTRKAIGRMIEDAPERRVIKEAFGLDAWEIPVRTPEFLSIEDAQARHNGRRVLVRWRQPGHKFKNGKALARIAKDEDIMELGEARTLAASGCVDILCETLDERKQIEPQPTD